MVNPEGIPAPSEATVRSRQQRGLRALGAAAFALLALTGCAAVGGTESSPDQAEIVIRDLLDSSVIDESRASIDAALGSGATRSQLAAQVDEQFKLGNIAGSTACLQTGLAYGLSDDEIVDDCHDAYLEEIGELR